MSSEEKKVSRRGYVKYAGAAVVVVAVGAAGAYYASQPPAPPPTTPVVTTPKPTTPGPTTPVPTTPVPTTPAGPKKSMYFNVWSWHPEVVEENMKIFNQQNNENGQVVVVGADYTTVVETKLMTKGPIDMMYADVPMASRWYMAGWLNPVDEHEKFKDILNDYDPATRDFTLFPADKKHFGYMYFTGACSYYYNSAVVSKWLGKEPDNWNDLPKTNEEMLDACRDMQKKGIAKNPYLYQGYAWSGGLPYTLENDIKNLGEELLKEGTFEPIFDVNTQIKPLFEYYNTLYKEELINTGCFAMMEMQHISAFTTGIYAFSQQRDYDIGTFNDPEKSKTPGKFHYYKKWPSKENWHLAYPCFYVTANHELFKRSTQDRERLDKLQQWYGWKDNTGKYTAAWKWSHDYLLGQPFPSVVDDPEMVTSWKRFMTDVDLAIRKDDNMKNAYMPIGYVGCIWYQEFKLKMLDIVPKGITGERSIEDCVTDLRNTCKDLSKKYV